MQLTPDKTYHVRTPGLRPAERLYLQRLLRRVHYVFPKACRVLDAGCGDGHISQALSELGCQVTGVDVAGHPGEWDRIRACGVNFCEGSAEALPFADAHFDAALVKDAFHHMQNPRQALAELQRVVKPGGPIVVIEANRYNPVFYVHLTLLGEHEHFTRGALRRFLRAADPAFTYTMAESRCLPWDAPWLLRLLEAGEETLERLKIFNPWLTYQIAVVRGLGKAHGQAA
jgi:ubiquinone/menaquinone biosynthesis C-methylase UbiE